MAKLMSYAVEMKVSENGNQKQDEDICFYNLFNMVQKFLARTVRQER